MFSKKIKAFLEEEARNYFNYSKLEQEILAEPKNNLLNVDEDAYINYLFEKYTIYPLVIDWDNITIDDYEKEFSAQECQKHEQFSFGGSNEPCKKQVIIHSIPFSGEKILFKVQPSSFVRFSYEIDVKDDSFSFEVTNWGNGDDALKKTIDFIISSLKQQANSLTVDVAKYNNELKQHAIKVFKERKKEILSREGLLTTLGFPIKRVNDFPVSFNLPILQKKIVIKPVISDSPFAPEPAINNEDYRAILQVCHDLGVAMERLPSTYQGKGEESLRDLFLLMLSLHFSSATGETFNKAGKTDVLIRHEGKNIFIAECKIWGGPKLHQETIDQCLSYLTWRDSKTAIIYFVKRKDVQKVEDTIEACTKSHPCYQSFKGREKSSWFNYHFLIPDTGKGVELAILFFHLPLNQN